MKILFIESMDRNLFDGKLKIIIMIRFTAFK